MCFPGTTCNFQACPPEIAKSLLTTQDGSEIALSGLIVGRIEEIGDVHSHEGEAGLSFIGRLNRIPNEQVVFNEWEKISQARSGIQYAQTEEEILDAYWQTLVAGKLSGGYDAAKAGFVQWDEVIRAKFLKLSTSKYLKWTNTVLALPSLIKMATEIAKSGFSAGPIMAFRSDMTVATNRRMFRTEEGHIGLAPASAKKGDCIAIFKGVKVPLVLRPAAGSSKWNLVGDCYIHGIMRGEVFDESICADFWIV
jgi:hypothetical protein